MLAGFGHWLLLRLAVGLITRSALNLSRIVAAFVQCNVAFVHDNLPGAGTAACERQAAAISLLAGWVLTALGQWNIQVNCSKRSGWQASSWAFPFSMFANIYKSDVGQ